MRRTSPLRSFRLALWPALVTVAALVASDPIAASSALISVDVPVPGGTAALARAIGIEPAPDRGRFVAELARLINTRTTEPLGDSDSRFRRLLAYLRSDAARTHAPGDFVPIPLPAATWSKAVFHRPLAPEQLFAAVMSDRAAAHLAHGLAALDDETLRFLVDHPAIVTRLYERNAPVFAGFAEHFRIHDQRVAPPGGDRAVPLWEAVVNAKVSEPDRFMGELYGRDKGRLAYLYDVIGHLDQSRAAFALGFWIDDASLRVDRFRALASVATSAYGRWRADKRPFMRPQQDLLSMFLRAQVTAGGRPGFPAWRTLWARAFDGDEFPADAVLELKNLGSELIDAAWLAEATLLDADARRRRDDLDRFAFGQRAFASAEGKALPDILVAIRTFPRFPMLMLTLERIGIGRPSVYVALARQADRLSGLDVTRRHAALAQFQGAIALVAHLVRVGTLDGAQAETLVGTLSEAPFDPARGYRGAIADWLQTELRPALAAGGGVEAALLEALAGAPGAIPARRVGWEGRQYRFDLVAFELRRLRRIREWQAGYSIDMELALQAIARMAAVGPSAANDRQAAFARLSVSLFELVDVVLGEALLSLTYAVHSHESEGAPRPPVSVASRHDFGLAERNPAVRLRAPWALPAPEVNAGAAWHVKGAILGLDIAIAPLALRRVHSDPLSSAPAIGVSDRETFATSLALMNPFALGDTTRDAIADAVALGQRRVEALAAGDGNAIALAREIAMDGRRVRALEWSLGRDERIGSLFSMTELLYLGGGRELDVHAWGMSALTSLGCLCSRLTPPGLWTALVGRPQLGLATVVADLNLRVAVTLRELDVPAALARWVIADAAQDFVDRVQPSDEDDWLTLVRTAQAVTRERIEDYVAAATAGGPLTLETGIAGGPTP